MLHSCTRCSGSTRILQTAKHAESMTQYIGRILTTFIHYHAFLERIHKLAVHHVVVRIARYVPLTSNEVLHVLSLRCFYATNKGPQGLLTIFFPQSIQWPAKLRQSILPDQCKNALDIETAWSNYDCSTFFKLKTNRNCPNIFQQASSDLRPLALVLNFNLFWKFAPTNWYKMLTFELDTMHRTCATCRHSMLSQGKCQSWQVK